MKLAVFVAILLLAGCGGDGGDNGAERVLEANGIPSGPSTSCDVIVTQEGGGTIHAAGGDCGNVSEAEEEDGESFPDTGEPVPPFLGGA